MCMLHRALADDVESGESSSERAIKPKSQGVARRFQHYELLIGEDGRPVELGRGAMGGILSRLHAAKGTRRRSEVERVFF